jgi:hypothetical protein
MTATQSLKTRGREIFRDDRGLVHAAGGLSVVRVAAPATGNDPLSHPLTQITGSSRATLRASPA